MEFANRNRTNIILGAILYILCFLAFHSHAQIAHFPFDSNLNDITAGYTSSTFGSPSLVTDGAVQAVELEGDEYLILTDDLHQNIDISQDLEIQIRFKITDTYSDAPFPGTGEFGGAGKRILLSNKSNFVFDRGFDIFVGEIDEEYRLIMSFGDDTEEGGTLIFNDLIEENQWMDLKLILRLNQDRPSIVYKLNGYYQHFPLNYLDVEAFKQSLNTQTIWVGTDQDDLIGDEGFAYAKTLIDHIKIYNPIYDGNHMLVSDALDGMIAHMNGTNILSENQQKALLTTIVNEWDDDTYLAIIPKVLDYLSTYEQEEGRVFEFYTEYIDPKEEPIAKALQFMLIQYSLDNMYTATTVTDMAGISFLDHEIFPGSVASSAPRVTGSVSIDGDYNTNPGYYLNNQEFVIRPTGYYAAPGEMVDVSLPNSLVNQGVVIHVGAHYVDLREDYRGFQRFPIMATKYPVNQANITVANPFGGAVYLVFPDGSNFGAVNIQFTNAVKSPYYSTKEGFSNSLSDYQNDLDNAYVNWVDIESDNFMATFPIALAEISPDANAILSPLNEIIGNFNILLGRPVSKIRSEYMISEPQSYTQGTLPASYPISIVNGDIEEADTYALPVSVLDPAIYINTYDGSTLLHELGHLHSFPTMVEEGETNVNIPTVMAFNTVLNYPLDTALYYSSGFQFLDRDRAALDWLLDPKFRNGEATLYDDVSYQLRGLSKYVDVASIFSWDTLGLIHGHWYDQALLSPTPASGIEYMDSDEYIEAASDQLGFNFAPLWELWGNIPSVGLVNQLSNYEEELRIRDRILYYRTLVPRNAAEYQQVYDDITPNIEEHHRERYNDLLGNYDESIAAAILERIDEILCKYYAVNCMPVLPVELATWTGRYDESKDANVLSWSTSSELNNDYFIIERSFDDQEFSELAEIDGQGSTSITTEYSYDDTDLKMDAIHYYRLRQVDINGEDKLFDTIAIQLKFNANQDIVIFPNPADDMIEINGLTSSFKLKIFDSVGRLVKRTAVDDGTTPIDISSLQSAMYFIEFRNLDDQLISMQRLVKL